MNSRTGIEAHRLPLTASQTGMWLYQQLDAASPSACAAEFVVIRGQLDEGLLEQALHRTVLDTETLRVRFEEDEQGQVWQVLDETPPGPLLRLDLRERSDPWTAAHEWMRADLVRPVDVRHEAPLSVALLRTEDECRLLYISVHHIAMDGYGFALFVQRLSEVFGCLDEGRPVPPAAWPPLGELLADEEEYRRSPRWQEDLGYWQEQLRDRDSAPGPTARLKPLTNLPLRETGYVDPATAQSLRALARQARTSLPTVAMAALVLYLRRLAGREQVTLDLTVTGRTGGVARAVPAMLANVLPLTVRCPSGLTVRELVRETSRQARGLLRHQRFPAGHLVRDLGAPKQGGHLGDWGINIMGYDLPLAFGRCSAELHNLSNGPCEGLGVNVYERSGDGSLRIDFNADRDVYGPAEVGAHHRRFLALLETLAGADPDSPVAALDVTTAEDRERWELAARGPEPEVPATLLTELVQRCALRSPDAVAVVDGATSLTYRELNARANRLARLLVARGAGPESHVALALPRTGNYLVAVLAVLKAGAACVPLDPEHPAERIRHVLAQTRPVCVLTTGGTKIPADGSPADPADETPADEAGADVPHPQAVRTDAVHTDVVRMDARRTVEALDRFSAADLDDGDRRAPLLPRHAAYVSYTSGSGGAPKGVVVEHRSLTYLYHDHERELIAPAVRAAGRPLRAALTAAFTFDTSWEALLFLAAGQEVHVIGERVRKDPDALCAYVDARGVDFLDVTPSSLHQLIACGLFAADRRRPGLLMVGGERLDAKLWQTLRAQPGTVSYNYYGPTECTVDAVYCRLDEQGDRPVIGRPGHHVRAYVLDGAGAVLPPGTPGELYLAGPQVARGYLGRPDLTAQLFLPDPFGAPGDRMYRTGDLVRWTDEGTLEFLGRTDHQLSLRGCRIEPGEVEAVLGRHPEVAQAAVTVMHPKAGGPALVAFVVPRGARLPEGLRGWAAARLPDHLTPARYLALDSLPLTAHGKLDRAALPTAADIPSPRAGRPARSSAERQLARLFARVLDVPDVGTDDDFFALGGNSLSAARLARQVGAELGQDLSLSTVFAAPTVAELARHLAVRVPENDSFGALLPLRVGRAQVPPLFCLHPAGGLGWCYAGMPRQLGPDRPVYALQARGLAESDPLPTRFAEMIDDYVARIRSVQPAGPYHLLGWSLGGALAHAVAARLQELGERVELLAMLDSTPISAGDRIPLGLDDSAVRGLLLEAAGRTADESGFLTERNVSAVTSVLANYRRLGATFTASVFSGDLLFFEATPAPGSSVRASARWEPWVTGTVEAHAVAASHHAMMRPEPLAAVCRLLARRLAAGAGRPAAGAERR
ncbi:amino acid adenylation domain-containing protein [Streptomyces sp. NPDC091272]|uniref:amino acid adenylation domain-containing protein n=1 Tax=Streptomyces sp. NPDC091272 TaxID=3365981 RepID=UPI00380E446B